MKFFAVLSTLLFFIPASVPAMSNAPEEINGIYERIHKITSPAHLEEGESCDAPYILAGDICVAEYDTSDRLALYQNSDGSLYFSALLFFSSGYSCTIGGKAEKSEEGWQYSDASGSKSEKVCELDIFMDDKNIHLKAQDSMTCNRRYCGAGGSLSHTEFPLAGKAKEQVSINKIKCMSLLDGAENCDQYEETEKAQ